MHDRSPDPKLTEDTVSAFLLPPPLRPKETGEPGPPKDGNLRAVEGGAGAESTKMLLPWKLARTYGFPGPSPEV